MPVAAGPALTIITCTRDPRVYETCLESIRNLDAPPDRVHVRGLEPDATRSAATRLNAAWEEATTPLLVFCHEDVIFPRDWLALLDRALEGLGGSGGEWGLLGPVGRRGKRFFGFYASQDEALHHGPLPASVDTLDELCLVVPRDLPLRFDESLGGYHLYGVDLALQCRATGRDVVAADLFVHHYTGTRGDVSRPPDYHRIRRRLQRKWRWKTSLVGRRVGTTSGSIHLGAWHGWL